MILRPLLNLFSPVRVMRNKTGVTILVLALLLIFYLFSGLYALDSGEHAVVLRFGKPVRSVNNPGIHIRLPFPFERVKKAHVSKVQTIMLNADSLQQECFTGDENLVFVQAMISFDVKDSFQYLFAANNVKQTIKASGQKILSMELAQMPVDDAMTSAKSMLRLAIRDKMQILLDQLGIGVRIISVELTDISPPLQVSSAFKAVSNARVKKQEIIRDAEGYANATVPKSRGIAAKAVLEANAYAGEILQQARSRTTAFHALLAEYQSNPKAFKQQRYTETLITIANQSNISVISNPETATFYLSDGQKVINNNSTFYYEPEDAEENEDPDIEVIEVE